MGCVRLHGGYASDVCVRMGVVSRLCWVTTLLVGDLLSTDTGCELRIPATDACVCTK